MSESGVASSASSGCCGFLSLILLVAGGVMYGVCQNASVNGNCGGNQEIPDAGLIMMYVGGAMLGVSILLCCCFTGVVCVGAACSKV